MPLLLQAFRRSWWSGLPARNADILVGAALASLGGAGAFACQLRTPSIPALGTQVLLHGLRILPSHASVEGMRIRAETDVRLQLPVLQIVPRFKPRPREIGNLVARNPHCRQPLHRRF